MISSPDLLAFTTDTDFLEQSTESHELPPDLSVPPHPHSDDASPWSKSSNVSFSKDFILISEFSEQVGPQPLLTIPDHTKACGLFDLNHFSLRIMSVDYQTTFTVPSSCGHPKLNFVEDSKVVLGDSREGAYTYVHHLTLYDLEARGFVRPFCMAYVSAEEEKIMQCFQELSAEFSKASDCLKTGNRKNFANEVDKKLSDLEYTRLILLKEMNRDRLSKPNAGERNGIETDGRATREKEENRNSELLLTTKEEELKEKRSMEGDKNKNNGMPEADKTDSEPERDVPEQPAEMKEGQNATCRSITWANKAEELAQVEKAIQEHRSLLKQITSYPNRKLRNPEFLPYDSDDAFHSLESDLDPNVPDSQKPESVEECSDCSSAPSHTPQLVISSACRQFDKRLKNLDELCDEYFLQQALQQLRSTEKSFRGDNSVHLSQYQTRNLLRHLKSTNFLFEDLCHPEAETGQLISRQQPRPKLHPPVSPLQSEPVSLDSYASCVEMVPIRLDLQRNGTDSVPTSPSDDLPLPPNFSNEDKCKNEEAPAPMKDSISSGESIEVLGTEKSCRTQGPVYGMETAPQRPAGFPTATCEGWKRRVVDGTRRENSEDSIEVLYTSATDSIIPEDLKASYPHCAIYEEAPGHDGEDIDGTHTSEDVLVQHKEKHQECQSSPSTPTIVINTPDPHMSLDLCNYGTVSPSSEPGSLQDKAFLFTPDDFSDSTSYHSLGSIGSMLSLDLHGETSTSGSRKKRARSGRAALNFLHQFPFAVHAMYSLLSGRTLVVLGSEERMVRRLVGALTMFTPHLGRCGGNVQPWTSRSLQIADLVTWKLIGYNRLAFPGTPPCLVRFSRYLSILDVDQKTLRCPAYKGSLICPLVEARTPTMRGTAYFLYAQSIITRLVSRAFLLTFSRGVQPPSTEARLKRVLGEFRKDDLKILNYLSELVTQHVTETSPAVLRFSYTACTVFKI